MQLHTDKPPLSGKLKLPEYFFQLLVEASADALLVMDEKGKIVFANAQAGRIFGYRPDDLVDKPIKLLIPDDLHKRHARNLEQASKNHRVKGAANELDLRGRRSDGREFAMDVGLSPLETN